MTFRICTTYLEINSEPAQGRVRPANRHRGRRKVPDASSGERTPSGRQRPEVCQLGAQLRLGVAERQLHLGQRQCARLGGGLLQEPPPCYGGNDLQEKDGAQDGSLSGARHCVCRSWTGQLQVGG
jgi:hypothetical protein